MRRKNKSGELAVKLKSLSKLVWVGLLMFIFGIASLFWPPLKAIVGSMTTSVACVIGGIVLMVLPVLVVGHGGAILLIAVGILGAYWFAHRHGQLRGKLEAIEDANQNTIDDRVEQLENEIKITTDEKKIDDLVRKGSAYKNGFQILSATALLRKRELEKAGS